MILEKNGCVWRQAPVIVKVKVGDKTDVQNSGKSVKNLGIKGSQSRPRLFQLHIRPARFCPALLIIQNITNIHFPFWTLGGRCVWGRSSKQANFVIKNIFPYAHICQHKLEDKCFRLILCYWKCEADVSSPSGCALAAVVLNWILDTQLWGEWAKLTQMFLLNIFALFNLIIIVSQCKASMGGEGQKLGLVYCNIYEKSKNGCFQSHPPCKTAK